MGPGNVQAGDRNAESPEHCLSFAADVEQARMKGDGDCEAGEDKVRGVVKRVTPSISRT